MEYLAECRQDELLGYRYIELKHRLIPNSKY